MKSRRTLFLLVFVHEPLRDEHVLRRRHLDVHVTPLGDLHPSSHELDDAHVVRHLVPFLVHELEPFLENLRLDDLRRLHLPQLTSVQCFSDGQVVVRLLHRRLALHREHRRAVLHRVLETPSRVVEGHERSRGVVDRGERGAVAHFGETVEHRVLSLLPRERELDRFRHRALLEDVAVGRIAHDDDLADLVHLRELLQAVQRDRRSEEGEILLRHVRSHPLADAAGEKHETDGVALDGSGGDASQGSVRSATGCGRRASVRA
eukprot:30957-Pelagococcus_subviridis.AAC.41